jgi:hypothetical protein
VLSTPKGYILREQREEYARIFKVRHEDERTEEELSLIVGAGGCVKDVFVHHRVYGTLRAELGVGTAVQVAEYMRSITGGKSSPLKNVTDGYHYHTVTASSAATLDEIESLLRSRGFLIER